MAQPRGSVMGPLVSTVHSAPPCVEKAPSIPTSLDDGSDVGAPIQRQQQRPSSTMSMRRRKSSVGARQSFLGEELLADGSDGDLETDGLLRRASTLKKKGSTKGNDWGAIRRSIIMESLGEGETAFRARMQKYSEGQHTARGSAAAPKKGRNSAWDASDVSRFASLESITCQREGNSDGETESDSSENESEESSAGSDDPSSSEGSDMDLAKLERLELEQEESEEEDENALTSATDDKDAAEEESDEVKMKKMIVSIFQGSMDTGRVQLAGEGIAADVDGKPAAAASPAPAAGEERRNSQASELSASSALSDVTRTSEKNRRENMERRILYDKAQLKEMMGVKHRPRLLGDRAWELANRLRYAREMRQPTRKWVSSKPAVCGPEAPNQPVAVTVHRKRQRDIMDDKDDDIWFNPQRPQQTIVQMMHEGMDMLRNGAVIDPARRDFYVNAVYVKKVLAGTKDDGVKTVEKFGNMQADAIFQARPGFVEKLRGKLLHRAKKKRRKDIEKRQLREVLEASQHYLGQRAAKGTQGKDRSIRGNEGVRFRDADLAAPGPRMQHHSEQGVRRLPTGKDFGDGECASSRPSGFRLSSVQMSRDVEHREADAGLQLQDVEDDDPFSDANQLKSPGYMRNKHFRMSRANRSEVEEAAKGSRKLMHYIEVPRLLTRFREKTQAQALQAMSRTAERRTSARRRSEALELGKLQRLQRAALFSFLRLVTRVQGLWRARVKAKRIRREEEQRNQAAKRIQGWYRRRKAWSLFTQKVRLRELQTMCATRVGKMVRGWKTRREWKVKLECHHMANELDALQNSLTVNSILLLQKCARRFLVVRRREQAARAQKEAEEREAAALLEASDYSLLNEGAELSVENDNTESRSPSSKPCRAGSNRKPSKRFGFGYHRPGSKPIGDQRVPSNAASRTPSPGGDSSKLYYWQIAKAATAAKQAAASAASTRPPSVVSGSSRAASRSRYFPDMATGRSSVLSASPTPISATSVSPSPELHAAAPARQQSCGRPSSRQGEADAMWRTWSPGLFFPGRTLSPESFDAPSPLPFVSEDAGSQLLQLQRGAPAGAGEAPPRPMTPLQAPKGGDEAAWRKYRRRQHLQERNMPAARLKQTVAVSARDKAGARHTAHLGLSPLVRRYVGP
eukprot:TRINITY_DN33901_c0_g1_i1.p1 TRINITY_DN33901_c0_g1~~TRINITY_DN33901_c0_g1_i1.p1  ORF type:complete len:1142 (+),score=266.71 TRINITY_DN33901_c0_g1_i1:157-3582(+)